MRMCTSEWSKFSTGRVWAVWLQQKFAAMRLAACFHHAMRCIILSFEAHVTPSISQPWANGFQMWCVLQLSQLVQLCLGLWLPRSSRNSRFRWHERMPFLNSRAEFYLQNSPKILQHTARGIKWHHPRYRMHSPACLHAGGRWLRGQKKREQWGCLAEATCSQLINMWKLFWCFL